MEFEAFAHELATLAVAQNASRIVEIDRMVDILKRLFPQRSERSIAARLLHEVTLMDGAVAWTGARGYVPKARRGHTPRLLRATIDQGSCKAIWTKRL